MIYTNSLDLFSSTLNLRRRYAPLPEEEWLTDEFWGLFPLLEWVGCVTALVFLVSWLGWYLPSEWAGDIFLGWYILVLHSLGIVHDDVANVLTC